MNILVDVGALVQKNGIGWLLEVSPDSYLIRESTRGHEETGLFASYLRHMSFQGSGD